MVPFYVPPRCHVTREGFMGLSSGSSSLHGWISCELLNQPPFDACHQHVDTDSYVAACNNSLCNYLAVDGLDCQFLEAYAESCSLRDIPLGDWRSTVQCRKMLLHFLLLGGGLAPSVTRLRLLPFNNNNNEMVLL